MKFFFSAALLCVACLGFLGAQSPSAGTIRGAVTLRSNGAPLHNVTVRILELRKSLETGGDGQFEFRGIAPGKYRVSAHMHALSDTAREVEVRDGAVVDVNFSLAIADVREEVTVTAAGQPELSLESFQSVTTVDGPALTLRNSAPSLGELLDNETGIAKRSFGPGSSRPVIRGFDGDRVLVLQDGVRTGTLSSQSGDHGEPVDGGAIERVEVVRGPATLLYGSNAIGGAVNIITRHHELDQHPHPGVSGYLSGLGGSANGLGGGNGGFELGAGNFLFWGSGGGQRTGDYSTPLGKVLNSEAELRQTSAGVAQYADHAFFSFNYGVQDGRYGIPVAPPGENGAEEEEGPVDLSWRRHNVKLHGGLRNLGGFLEGIRGTLNYSNWRHTELEGADIGTEFFNKQFTWRAEFNQQRGRLLSGSFGAWGLHRDYKAVGAEALSPPVIQDAVAVFGVEEVRFERFRLQFGGRIEHNGFDATGRDGRSFTGASGGAGISIPTWTGGSVVFNYTTSFRAPAIEELYNLGPHPGNLTFEVGNENLRRERAHGLELSLRHSSTRARMELTAFSNRMSDFVFLAPTGEIEEGLVVADYAQADARYLGAEAKVDLQVAPVLWLNLGFDVVDAQLRQTKTPLPRIPPVRGRVGVDFRKGGLTVRPELLLTNRQHQIFTTETPTAGFGVVNLTSTYTIATQHISHIFGGSLFNAGDRLYRNHLSFIKDFAPEIGRGVRFSYTMNFY